MAFKRILLMVLYNLPHLPFWWPSMCRYAKKASGNKIDPEAFRLLKKVDRGAVKGGRVKIESSGQENIPAEGGFIFFPNHQGMFDVLAIIDCCDRAFSVVAKKELENIFFIKQVFQIIRAKFMDREDIRQSMRVIKETADCVKEGTPYLIFPEGTRSKLGNKMVEFKSGAFKSAYYARCPIVPVAIIDSFKPFDTNSAAPVTVQVHFLKPLEYEEYKNLKTVEVAEKVKKQIEECIEKNLKQSEEQ